jgi:hypothetical protein
LTGRRQSTESKLTNKIKKIKSKKRWNTRQIFIWWKIWNTNKQTDLTSLLVWLFVCVLTWQPSTSQSLCCSYYIVSMSIVRERWRVKNFWNKTKKQTKLGEKMMRCAVNIKS